MATLFLSLLLIATSACAAGMPNPMTEFDTFELLCAAVPDVVLMDAPEGATEVSYHTIEGAYIVAQIAFTLDGHAYTFRAASAATEDIADDREEAFTGMYIDFDEDVDDDDIREGDLIPFTIPDAFKLVDFELEYDLRDAAALMEWYLPAQQTQYSLYSETAGLPDMPLAAVAEKLLFVQP